MNQNFSVNVLFRNVFIAISLALIGSITILFPFFKYISLILWMAPLVIIARRQNYLSAVLTLVISGVIMAFFMKQIGISDGEVITAVLVGTFGSLAFIFTYCFNKQINPIKTILIGIIFLSIVQLSGLVVVLMNADLSLDKSIKDYSHQVLELKENKEALDMLEKEGYNKTELLEAFTSVMNFISITLPALLVIDAIITVILSYLGLYFIQKRLRLEKLIDLEFSRWRIPWYGAWFFIIGLSFALLGDSFSFSYHKYISVLGYNIILGLLPLLALIGVSITTFIFTQVKGLVGVKIILIIMAIFNLPVILFVMAILGVFDPFIDIRGYIIGLQKKS